LALFEGKKNVRGPVLMAERARKVEGENFSSNKLLLIYVLTEQLNGQIQEKHK
jgi:hypothetical protein